MKFGGEGGFLKKIVTAGMLTGAAVLGGENLSAQTSRTQEQQSVSRMAWTDSLVSEADSLITDPHAIRNTSTAVTDLESKVLDAYKRHLGPAQIAHYTQAEKDSLYISFKKINTLFKIAELRLSLDVPEGIENNYSAEPGIKMPPQVERRLMLKTLRHISGHDADTEDSEDFQSPKTDEPKKDTNRVLEQGDAN